MQKELRIRMKNEPKKSRVTKGPRVSSRFLWKMNDFCVQGLAQGGTVVRILMKNEPKKVSGSKVTSVYPRSPMENE